jgi:hypothetical protein
VREARASAAEACLRFTSQTSSDGVTEQLFTLGGQHKKAPGIVARARRFVAECGFAVAAVDVPGHGDRPRTEEHDRVIAEMRARAQAGGELTPLIAGFHALLAGQILPEWRAVLDAVQQLDYGAETSAVAAAQITVPVESLVQWDDEQVPRAASLALFDVFASAEKTLHANAGKHADLPVFELDSALRFFTRQLGCPPPVRDAPTGI